MKAASLKTGRPAIGRALFGLIQVYPNAGWLHGLGRLDTGMASSSIEALLDKGGKPARNCSVRERSLL